MNLLFSKNGLKTLESLSFTRTLYAFDFDGTLSKIVKRPGDACLMESTKTLLEELMSRAPVAVISGRSIDDLKVRVEAPYLIGNHGLEASGSAQSSLGGAERVCAIYKEKLEAAGFPSGVEIEDKTYSLAVHYRRARNKKAAKAQIDLTVGSLVPAPRIVPGKSVVNILPAGAPHKGMALQRLMEKSGMTRAFYIGDDDTDEDVFALQDPRILSVRVGQKKNSQARFYIRRQSEMNALLKKLVRFYDDEK